MANPDAGPPARLTGDRIPLATAIWRGERTTGFR
jgi:hypothetical protein